MAAPAAAAPKAAKAGKGAKKAKFVLDLSVAEKDKLLKISDFETFLSGAIKVDGKAGNIGGKVDIRREGGKVIVESTVPFSKRYFKYLLRKYLKKNELRDYLRVIANSKAGYELRYFKMAEEEEGESA